MLGSAMVGCALPGRRALLWLAIGGFCGLLVWEVWARALTPVFVGGPLEPWTLIVRLIQNITGNGNLDAGLVISQVPAEVIHYVTGTLLYPVGYYIFSRGIISFGPLVDGIIWGVVTWVLALGVFAGMAGLPFMLGWIELSWFSGMGHVLYAVTAVLVTEGFGNVRQLATARPA